MHQQIDTLIPVSRIRSSDMVDKEGSGGRWNRPCVLAPMADQSRQSGAPSTSNMRPVDPVSHRYITECRTTRPRIADQTLGSLRTRRTDDPAARCCRTSTWISVTSSMVTSPECRQLVFRKENVDDGSVICVSSMAMLSPRLVAFRDVFAPLTISVNSLYSACEPVVPQVSRGISFASCSRCPSPSCGRSARWQRFSQATVNHTFK
jgi:hypothetical protein